MKRKRINKALIQQKAWTEIESLQGKTSLSKQEPLMDEYDWIKKLDDVNVADQELHASC